jgi:hypothetical protein
MRRPRQPYIPQISFARVLLAAFLAALTPIAAQSPFGALQATQSPIPTTPQTVSGTVVDAASGQPIFRALVQLNSGNLQRALLTDSEGHFSFANVDPATINLTATKPGFYNTITPADQSNLRIVPADLATPVQLRLYPEAILKGTISGPDSQPLEGILIQPHRDFSDDFTRRSMIAGVARSNARGQFRIPVPPGDYTVQTLYTEANPTTAIMPLAYPGIGTSGESTLHLQPGQQTDLDLRPRFVPLLEVTLHLNGGSREIGALTAISSDGTTFPVAFHREDDAELRAKLPSGNYILQARPRGFGTDGLEQASVALAPAQHHPIPLTLEFAPIAAIPIQVAFDESVTSNSQPNTQNSAPPSLPDARTLILSLQPLQPDSSISDEFLRPTQRRGENTVSFITPPGTYRLRSANTRGWYIVSATYGGADVLLHPLVIASGTGSTPLLLTLSNQFSSLRGTVTLGGAPQTCWIDLLSNDPAAMPLHIFASGPDGSINQPSLPPGRYRAIAFAHHHPIDPDDPQALAPYSSHVVSVTLDPATPATITLEAVPDSEVRP